ncbi:MAG: phosphatidylglycerophosphate synthase, partial [Kiritimatiellia bacterium]
MLEQLPNALTASRGLAGPAVFLLVVGLGWTDAAFYLFWFAIWTDLVDGGLARWLNATSDVGEWLDPMADKFLSGFVWFTIGVMGWAPWWLVGLMLFRDLAVT